MFRRNPEVAWRVYDGEAFMLSSGNTLHVLNEIATHIWLYLEDKKGVDDVVKRVCENFDTDEETARSDVQELLTEFKNKELVIEEG